MSNLFPALVPVSSGPGGLQSMGPLSSSATSGDKAANDPQSNYPWALWHPQAGLVVSPNTNFVPMAAASSYRSDDDGKATVYTAPSLLDDEFIYLMFCPTHTENSGDLFGRLNVSEESLRGKIIKCNDHYSLNPSTIGSWERLEKGLVDVAYTLLKMLPGTVPKLTWPRLPEDCGYRHFHSKERFAIASASRSIKAFRFLAAFVSFALALHMTDEGDICYIYDDVRRRSSHAPDAAWFDLLAVSYVSNFAPNFRIGGFINPYTTRWLPYIDKFVQAGVPVWLLWGPKKREQPPLDRRALVYWPPERVVDNARIRSLATTSVILPTYHYDPFAMNQGAPLYAPPNPKASFWAIPRSPSPNLDAASSYNHNLPMDETPDASHDAGSQPHTDNPPPIDNRDIDARELAVAALNEFFVKRARKREERLAIETPTEKQRQEQREAHVAKTKMYTKTSTMYMWVEQADGSYNREQVFSKQFEVEWGNFTTNQRRYTGHLNEWDLCPQYPLYSKEHPKEAESDSDGSSEDEEDTSHSQATSLLVPIPASSSDRPQMEAEPLSTMEGDESLRRPRVEVVHFSDFIKYRLGCNIFSGSNWRTSIEKGKDISASKAMMALSFKAESMPPGPEVGESLVQVVRTLSKPASFTFRDLPDSFDHGASNGIHLDEATLQITLAQTHDNLLFLIHPPGYVDRFPWAIAVVDASTVLQIIRRGWQSMSVIARELTRQGTRFSTVSAEE
ncbi:hypothetical protein HYPSUDRAFT_210004 [Hypholoma sublateritium FD-334 SS-4]|uniref:Uncharacterized protein n=1 Tax=Hypholoma sublateritium (strain FD-334 SS-4) TaxID=945553 RepID=A0A0D2N821_HYPSF|nr:hypothetical protein HYPSUDRAFT_210004 [Hypholoma sublateritium FD-334 SS-4]